jgi:hypothetical protein
MDEFENSIGPFTGGKALNKYNYPVQHKALFVTR